MSEPATVASVSLSASGYEDGLGRRTLEFDRETGAMVERLHLRPELGAFEAFLLDRAARAAAFDDERFARVRRVERDARHALTVVSSFVSGHRLSDLLEAATALPADEATSPSVDAALGFLLDVLPALGALHISARHAHGILDPGRMVLTPAGQVVILDSLYGQAVERLQFNRRRLWLEFGVASPPVAGPTRLDIQSDLAQASLAAMMIVIGRPLREDDYPDRLSTLLTEVIEIAQIRGGDQFAAGLRTFCERTLPLPGRRQYDSARAAADAVGRIAEEIGAARCQAALAAFVDDMNRVIGSAPDDTAETIEDPTDAAIAAALGALTSDRAPAEEWFDEPPQAAVAGVEGVADAGAEERGNDLERTGRLEPEPVEPVSVLAEPFDGRGVAPGEPSMADAEVERLIPLHEEAGLEAGSETWREPEPESAAPPVSFVEAPPFENELAAAAPPEPEPEPAPAPAPTVVPTAGKSTSKRKRRGSKGHRDKLRSNAAPPPQPVPAVPVPIPVPPVAPVQVAPIQVAPGFGRISNPLRDEAPVPVPISAGLAAEPRASIPLRLKADPPAAFSTTPRQERYEPEEIAALPYVDRGDPSDSARGEFPWKLAAAAVLVVLVGIGAGRAYLPDRSRAEADGGDSSATIGTAGPPPIEVIKTGSIEVTSQPAGAKLLLDGKPVGETPVTLGDVLPGKHVLTFITSSGTVKKVVRVEPGKAASLDVPVYSGWIAVFSPIPLDIAENGKAIGTTEQGRLMLTPGRHHLHLSNRELGYTADQIVDIEPGEERSISVQPTGELNLNAIPWAEIWIDGKKVGETPVAKLAVPLGTHEVVFKNPRFSDRRTTVTVTATAPVAASVDFSR